jgi:hypothetical protein
LPEKNLSGSERTQRRDRHGFSPCSRFVIQPSKRAEPEHACFNYQRTEREDSKGKFDSQGKFLKNPETAGLEYPRNSVKPTLEAPGRLTTSHLFNFRNPSLTARLWYFQAPYSHKTPSILITIEISRFCAAT